MRTPVTVAVVAICSGAAFAAGLEVASRRDQSLATPPRSSGVAVADRSEESDKALLDALLINENAIVATLKQNDIESFGRMLPDDLIDIEDDGIHTKAEWLKEFRAQKDRGYLFVDFAFEHPQLIGWDPTRPSSMARKRGTRSTMANRSRPSRTRTPYTFAAMGAGFHACTRTHRHSRLNVR